VLILTLFPGREKALGTRLKRRRDVKVHKWLTERYVNEGFGFVSVGNGFFTFLSG